MAENSRRTFLKAASATAAASAVLSRIPAWADPASPAQPVQLWSTFRDQRHAPAESLAWKSVAQISPGAIVLSPQAARQQILGFGAAMTDASCYLLSQLHDDERGTLMHELFDPGELALNVCRTCIGSSDYSRSVYSFDESDQDDPELKNFSIDHDKAYILPVLRDARRLNPDLFLFSSPWSPPGWMKSNRSMLGGAMRKPSFAPYADYFVKFLAAYREAGVAIDAVTVQNEVDTDQDGRMSACLWGQEYEIGFVKDHLGPALRKQAANTKIWILDHNYNLWGRAVDELSDPGVYEYVDGVAWHGYVGAPDAMTRVHDAFPQKNSYWTEGGPDIRAADYQTDWAKSAQTFNGILNNWARSITAWNIALDEEGKPNVGPFSCGGLVTIENATHKVTRSGQYWAFAHYSKHVRRGATVIASNGVGDGETASASGGISHVAFRNPDGTMVVVLANSGDERKVQLVLGSSALDVELPADSVNTLQWS
ncbi:MAG TPA: glycoside hydrolase family 30 beta sandwich domain-containing protein [Terracidiphilus sp.]|nr:glycoside hydrolase family 30 beta sandwich domain-containing protein [Terracidiphilus sp.]